MKKKKIIINQSEKVIFGETIIVEEYLNKIRPCLKEIINDLRKSGIWKI